jgi:ribonuclease HI
MSLDDPTIVWTDGACLGNPGPGGWAWAGSKESFAAGHEEHTTNQRMELLAVIEALAAHEGRVEIRSDSTYVVNCFKDRWWAGWRARGWRNSQGKPVANQDLWERLIGEVVDLRPGQITLSWVKGHSTDVMNNLCDELATRAARLQSPTQSL